MVSTRIGMICRAWSCSRTTTSGRRVRTWRLSQSHELMAGSITNAVKSVRRVAGFSLLVNVECQSLEEGDEAIAAGANIVMLDNLVGEELHSAAKELKKRWKGKREFLIETSGGIVEDSLTSRLGPGEWPGSGYRCIG